VTLDVAIGTYDNFAGPTLNDQFYSLTAVYHGFYGKSGVFEDDFDGSYFEAGYGGRLSIRETDLLGLCLRGDLQRLNTAGWQFRHLLRVYPVQKL